MTLHPVKSERIPPRERILATASALFSKHGIRAIGVDAVAEAAGTNKMTLYRHFSSKDELVAEYLRRLAAEADTLWDRLATEHPNDPRAQLRGWLATMGKSVTNASERGCPLANAAVELAEKGHPARRVVEEHKKGQRDRLVALCRATGGSDPEMLADALFLLIEGARVSSQSLGPDGPVCRLVRMGEALIDGHAAKSPG